MIQIERVQTWQKRRKLDGVIRSYKEAEELVIETHNVTERQLNHLDSTMTEEEIAPIIDAVLNPSTPQAEKVLKGNGPRLAIVFRKIKENAQAELDSLR